MKARALSDAKYIKVKYMCWRCCESKGFKDIKCPHCGARKSAYPPPIGGSTRPLNNCAPVTP